MSYTNGLDDPTLYFNTVLYTGTGATHNITGVGFQPDWVWIKRRNGSGYHILTDAVRGVNSQLYSNDSTAEGTLTNNIQSFDSDGFTLGTNSDVNGSSDTYASWNWLASNTTASNTDGSITSTVSANTTSGFSIVSYTGTGSNATVGHGLGSAPKMVIIKNRTTAAQNWQCYHSALGGTQGIELNTNGVAFTDSTRFNNTDPTSSVFSIGTATDVNASSASIIAYCFADVKGFSKFGSYVGNGNADGTFVYTGFKPAFVLIKRSDSGTNSWLLFDNKRVGYNPDNNYLFPNLSNVESTGDLIDIVSNGFKSISTGSGVNSSGATYIYMAFAEEPLVGDNPATAR
jgi:hypothetical protein